MTVEQWPLSRLRLYERNPRRNDKAVDRMVASIREYGFAVPCLARSDGECIDGHLRAKAAAKMGITEVPVIPCDGWTAAQVKAFRLMVNRSVGWAEWDEELLALELTDLKDLAFELNLTGFDLSELEKLLGSNGSAAASTQSTDQSGDLRERFQILIDCKSEQEQGALLERLDHEGFSCRALIS